MYRLQNELDELKEFKLEENTLFDSETANKLIALARHNKKDVTLYYERGGDCVGACEGDDTVASRYLKHIGWNRLSEVRVLRVVAPHTEIPRGRDLRELVKSSLDLMVILTTEGFGVLIEPQFENGLPTEESTVGEVLPMDSILNLSLETHLAKLDDQLGKHKRITKPKKGDRPVLLLGIEFTDNKHKDRGGSNLDELERLATTADLHPHCRIIQKRKAPHAGTFIGKGKVDEIRSLILDEGLELVLVGCDLPYTTIHKLTEAIGVPVIDRSQLILEIFASHAMTNEGRLQVKLAQLDHSMHRLLKEEKDLDRQGGGIGMRGGAGETASTLVKRRIHQKKVKLEKRLEVIKQQREEGRFLRASGPVARVAMAGYTNAGKSTLLNALCGSVEAEAADKFFTTLTTTTRRIELPSGRPMLLSDTVGFVEKLPHHLVAAFESTLSESACADLTLVVVQSDVETLKRHKATVDDVLTDLGQPLEKRLTVLSKIDLLSTEERKELEKQYPGVIGISSVTGEGVEKLLKVISEILSKGDTEIELLLPFGEMVLVDELHRYGQIIRKEWTEEGFRLRARLPEKSLEKMKKFEVI